MRSVNIQENNFKQGESSLQHFEENLKRDCHQEQTSLISDLSTPTHNSLAHISPAPPTHETAQPYQQITFTDLLNLVSASPGPNSRAHHFPEIPTVTYPQLVSGHATQNSCDDFPGKQKNQITQKNKEVIPGTSSHNRLWKSPWHSSFERGELSTRRGMGSDFPLPLTHQEMNDSLTEKALSDSSRQSLDGANDIQEGHDTLETISHTQQEEGPLELTSSSDFEFGPTIFDCKIEVYSVKLSQAQLIWIASTPVAKKIGESRLYHINAFMKTMKEFEPWKSSVGNIETKIRKTEGLIRKLVVRLWNLNARILMRLGAQLNSTPFNDEQISMLSWYLYMMESQQNISSCPTLIEQVQALWNSSTKKKFSVNLKWMKMKWYSEKDLYETKIAIIVLGSYYKSINSDKWEAFFPKTHSFVFMLEQIRQRLSNFHHPLRSQDKKLENIFPWYDELNEELHDLIRVVHLPKEPLASYLKSIKDWSKTELKQSRV
ncbi:hypothetical protein O181_037580 [Austropuccinia psidii MF-1]|uniref:Uncharacterized protein n=1 Tax=Austropuccinia psidii MF-1 TaxID=1389203 RepID=A0A9Q3D8F9_9BASI|nr:hypothetical protein [Austropuccinia psidii MF-1]